MRYFLGIDGGGSMTVAMVATEAGQIIGRGESGRSNFRGIEAAEAIDAIRDAMVGAVEQADLQTTDISAACFGLAGAGRLIDRSFIKKGLNQAGLPKKLIIVDDMKIAMASVLPQGWGLILNAGTGTIAVGKDEQGKIDRVDGWGYLLGDEGSGYAIGLEVLKASLRSYDGRTHKTMLEESICRHFKITNPGELLELPEPKLHSPTAIADLARLAIDAAQQKDEIALRIVEQAGADLVRTASSLIGKFDWSKRSFQACLMGGLLSNGGILRNKVEAGLQKFAHKIEIVAPYLLPVCGALLIAAEQIGITNKQRLVEQLRQNC